MPFRRQHEGSDLCAIFVHAGAGFHSHANERLHLGAVNDAAKVAMAILKNGGDAMDAVEMAIRLLEDREITNAGYGSNLTVEGHVECDATMVDHLGRSGAVGCISQIKNPIAVARLILDASSEPLSLQRVPPNLLVGPGATDFAAEHGIPILPHDYLVSESARNRWLSWKHDLLTATVKESGHGKSLDRRTPKLQRHDSVINGSRDIRDLPVGSDPTKDTMTTSRQASLSTGFSLASAVQPSVPKLHEPDPSTISRHGVDPLSYPEYARISKTFIGDISDTDTHDTEITVQSRCGDSTSPLKRQRLNNSMDGSRNDYVRPLQPSLSDVDDSHEREFAGIHTQQSTARKESDVITDTVGAIAIDCFGNIAAGSSSGGIGMKHKGRCGPAALVGIGTAVIPASPDDPEKTCVATVTSGTGEHMATTAAAATAADRIYLRVRRDGTKLKSCDEDEALHSMIKNDFMKHPGVRDQPCVGAIGILAVKKTRDGIYFYFGHNTDSFAISSMHSDERKPVCTMSRSKGNGSIAQGGRVARPRRPKH